MANGENSIKVFRDRYDFPLSFTRHAVDRLPGGFDFGEPAIFLIDPSSSLDLFDFGI